MAGQGSVIRTTLPIRILEHDFHAAADGQLGGIMKVYRDWRSSGDTGWMRGLWSRVKKSLNYCIDTWDPQQKGVVAGSDLIRRLRDQVRSAGTRSGAGGKAGRSVCGSVWYQ
jgi:hypothetical protein